MLKSYTLVDCIKNQDISVQYYAALAIKKNTLDEFLSFYYSVVVEIKPSEDPLEFRVMLFEVRCIGSVLLRLSIEVKRALDDLGLDVLEDD